MLHIYIIYMNRMDLNTLFLRFVKPFFIEMYESKNARKIHLLTAS